MHRDRITPIGSAFSPLHATSRKPFRGTPGVPAWPSAPPLGRRCRSR